MSTLNNCLILIFAFTIFYQGCAQVAASDGQRYSCVYYAGRVQGKNIIIIIIITIIIIILGKVPKKLFFKVLNRGRGEGSKS